MDKAKAFMFVGALVLATSVLSVPVDPNAPDEIAAILAIGIAPPHVLRTNGEVYQYDYDGPSWYRVPHLDVPVPVSEIADWQLGTVITHSGDWWYKDMGAGGTWELVPRPEWSPIQSSPQSLGSVKDQFR
jgi:hypothetical protein